MLKKPECDVFVHRVVLSKDERNLQHVLAVERHPCRAIGLVEMPARRKLRTSVEDADVIQAEKAAGKYVSSLAGLCD